MPDLPNHTPSRRRRVFIIEPNPVTRARITTLLQSEGYAVTAVPTLEAALTSGFWNGDPARLLVLHPPTQSFQN